VLDPMSRGLHTYRKKTTVVNLRMTMFDTLATTTELVKHVIWFLELPW